MVTLTRDNVSEVLATLTTTQAQASGTVPLTERLMHVADVLIARGEIVDVIYVHTDGRRTDCRLLRRGTGRYDANVLLRRFADGRVASHPVEFARVELPAAVAARLERLAATAQALQAWGRQGTGHNIRTGQFTAGQRGQSGCRSACARR